MRDEDHIQFRANPIFPVLAEQQAGAGKIKKDNAADVLARLDRVRDEKFQSPTGTRYSGETANTDSNGFTQGSLSFADLIDTINPLQHIPVVSTIYRTITDDDISPVAKIAGDSLFLGPVGAVGALVDVAVETVTGKDIGEHVVSLFDGNESPATEVDAGDGGDVQNAEIPGYDSASGQLLSATEPVFFNSASSENATPSTVPVAGFAGSTEPMALGSLPSDILAALYSGQAVQPLPGQLPPDIQGVATNNDETEEMARWGLFAAPEDTSVAPSAAARAYSGNMLDQMQEPGAVGFQGGWFSTVMPDIVSRYEHSATLQRQTHRPIVDVQQ